MTGRKWVLLVDDNAFDADLALRSLAEGPAPPEVRVARDGEEALDRLYGRGAFAACPEERPSVVLLDMKMPRVNGLEVLRQLKADPQLRTIPVVMLTSSREEADVARCYEGGANAYVVKPVDFNQYSAALRAIETFWMVFNEPPPHGLGPEPPGVSKGAVPVAVQPGVPSLRTGTQA